MAAAYSVLADDGVRNPAYFIDRVTDAQGRILFEHRASPERVVSAEAARLVTDVLIDNVRGGTGTRARLTSGQPAAGKTGTTNESSDVWFVGYTPQLAVSVWMGSPTERVPMSFGGGATGGRYPAYTWGLLMNSWTKQFPITEFPAPEARAGGECLHNPITDSCYDPRRADRQKGYKR
jgi:membrane peptidoglycan carboxypeptidase